MATDTWTDTNANWTTSADWSLGAPPGAGNSVVINSGGDPQVTAAWTTFADLTNAGTIDIISAGINQVNNSISNSGTINIDAGAGQGGSTLKSTNQGATITNTGTINLGNTTSGSASTLMTGTNAFFIENQGTMNVYSGSGVTDVINAGTVIENDSTINLLSGAQCQFKQWVAGTGTINLQNGAFAQFSNAVGSGQSIAFDSHANTVTLQDSVDFAGEFTNFSVSGDLVRCADFTNSTTTASYHQVDTNHAYVLLSQGAQSATIKFEASGITSASLAFGATSTGLEKITHT